MDKRNEYKRAKTNLRRKMLAHVDLEKLAQTNSDTAREEVLGLIRSLISDEAAPLSFAERERLAREILDEIFALGPLEPLLKDPTVSDILVNRFDRIYIERGGKLELTNLSFDDEQHLKQIIDLIVSRVGRRIDESSPMVDARLADGSRVMAIIPPLAIDGAVLSVRRFERDPITGGERSNNVLDEMRRPIHGIAVAVLTEDRERQVALQNSIARKSRELDGYHYRPR